MTTSLVLTVIRKMIPQLIKTGLIMALSIVIMQVNQTLGILMMMIYSGWMVVSSSRREMPLVKFTAILPGAMSLACFLIMLSLIGVQDPTMPLIGLAAGLLPGWLMARGHRIYREKGVLYAKRTYFYILIWMLSMLFIQGATLLGLREITEFGFLLNGFSTTMAVVLSIFLFMRSSSFQAPFQSPGDRLPSVLIFTGRQR